MDVKPWCFGKDDDLALKVQARYNSQVALGSGEGKR